MLSAMKSEDLHAWSRERREKRLATGSARNLLKRSDANTEKIVGSRQEQSAGSERQEAGGRRQAAGSRRQAAGGRRQKKIFHFSFSISHFPFKSRNSSTRRMH